MTAKALYTYLSETGNGLTRDKQYTVFELFGSFHTVNDDGVLVGVSGGGSTSWRLDSLGIGDEIVWEREKKGEVRNEGQIVAGGVSAEGRYSSSAEKSGQASREDYEVSGRYTDQR